MIFFACSISPPHVFIFYCSLNPSLFLQLFPCRLVFSPLPSSSHSSSLRTTKPTLLRTVHHVLLSCCFLCVLWLEAGDSCNSRQSSCGQQEGKGLMARGNHKESCLEEVVPFDIFLLFYCQGCVFPKKENGPAAQHLMSFNPVCVAPHGAPVVSVRLLMCWDRWQI